MSHAKLLLLGQPLLVVGNNATHLRPTKPNLLAWYLAAQPGQFVSRTQLTALFWENTPETAARAALSTTLNRLRQALPVWPLVTDGDLVAWQEHPELMVDLARFLALSRLDNPTVAQLAEAVALWRGPFLQTAQPEGQLFAEWLETQRATLESQVLHLLGQLLPLEQAAAAWQAMITHARQALEINPCREEFHRSLMLALYRTGDTEGALSHYQTLKHRLQAELQISPHPSTKALRDAILAGTVPTEGPAISLTPPDHQGAPLIGREAELAQLEQALKPGGPRLVFVTGEAGIGKSSLILELLRRRQGVGTVLVGRCYHGFGDLPFAPFIEALNPTVNQLESSWSQLPDLWLAEAARLLPDLAVLRPQLLGPTSPFEYRTRLLEALTRFLGTFATPCLVVIEDLHWADESSLQLLAYLARQATPVQLLVTLRPEEASERLQQLRSQLHREGLAAEFPLGPLRKRDVAQLVINRTGKAHPRVAQRLFAEAEGHPLYTTELLAALQETGQLQGRLPKALPVPPTVQGVIEGRLRRLGPKVKGLLTALAIHPRGVPLNLLEPLLGLEPAVLLSSIETALAAGILQEKRGERGADHLAFSHAVLQRVVLEGTSLARQESLHRQAFAVFREQTPAAGYTLAQARTLAYHACAGRLWHEGLTWAERAAQLAKELFSYAEATQLLEQALVCLQALGPNREHLEREVDLRVTIARLGEFYHRPGQMVQWLAPAQRAAQALGDPDRLRLVAVTRAESWLLAGRTPRALRALEALLERVETNEQRCHVFFLLGLHHAMQGKVGQALRHYLEAAGLLDPEEPSALRLLVQTNVASAQTFLGQLGPAEDQLEQTLAEAQERRFYPVEANARVWLAALELCRGNWQRAQAHALASLEVPFAAEHPWHVYFGQLQLARAQLKQGQPERALATITGGFERAHQLGTVVMQDRLYASQAEAYLALGQVEAALHAIARGSRIAQQLGSGYGLALLEIQGGRAAACQGDRRKAQHLLQAALARFEEQQALPDLARCHGELAALLGDQPQGLHHRQQASALMAELQTAQ